MNLSIFRMLMYFTEYDCVHFITYCSTKKSLTGIAWGLIHILLMMHILVMMHIPVMDGTPNEATSNTTTQAGSPTTTSMHRWRREDRSPIHYLRRDVDSPFVFLLYVSAGGMTRPWNPPGSGWSPWRGYIRLRVYFREKNSEIVTVYSPFQNGIMSIDFLLKKIKEISTRRGFAFLAFVFFPRSLCWNSCSPNSERRGHSGCGESIGR